MLPNTPVDRSALADDGNTLFFQLISAVEAIEQEEQQDERVTPFDKRNNVQWFSFETVIYLLIITRSLIFY